MTVMYNPRVEWVHEEFTAQQPRLLDAGELVDGDLCDIVVGRRYCQEHAARPAVDANGRVRILCAEHAEKYFPSYV